MTGSRGVTRFASSGVGSGGGMAATKAHNEAGNSRLLTGRKAISSKVAQQWFWKQATANVAWSEQSFQRLAFPNLSAPSTL